MAKSKVGYWVTVKYPYKEHSNEVDEFISESFKLYGIRECGFGADFHTRDVDGYYDNVDQVNELREYLSCFPFGWEIECDHDNTCGLCGQILDENGFCPEYDE